MSQVIEITLLDVRYETHRLKIQRLEERLLSSIAERGIERPLEGVEVGQSHVLLDGFKRYRCARKLRMATVPYTSLGQDEVLGILNLLRPREANSLSILEQARFVEELARGHRLSVAEIAADLSRSKAWVSLRLALIAQMSPAVSEELFAGRFPVYAYMSVVRPFMRVNNVSGKQIDSFVKALSGKNLSTREIEQLLHGFFRGPDSFRKQILEGNLALPLQQIDEAVEAVSANGGLSEFERVLLGDLEHISIRMQRVMGKSCDPRVKSRSFFAQAHLLCAAISSRAGAFIQSINELHDRSRQA
jgi:hypothetical protein